MSRLEMRNLVIDIPGRADGLPLNLQLEPTQVWGVLGPNGVGKTTLLHTLAGLRAPRSGEVLIDGKLQAAYTRRQVAQQIGVIFQEQLDGFPATVMETALIGRHPHIPRWGHESADDLAITCAALRRLDVDQLAARQINTLSGGERQRVVIATVLAQRPTLWLADEPSNHLDLHHQVEVMCLLTEQASAGDTVMLCLHDLNLAARWCDHILLLYPGGAHRAGSAKDLLQLDLLERLYGQRLATIELDGAAVFVPVK